MFEINFSVEEIEETLELCWKLKNEMDKKLQYEFELYKNLFYELEMTIEKVCKDISCAEEDKKLAQNIYDKNTKLREKLKVEIERLEKEVKILCENIKSCESSISQLKKEKSSMNPPSSPTSDNKEEKEAYQIKLKEYKSKKNSLNDKITTTSNQMSALKESMRENKERIDELKIEISKIDSANISLNKLIIEITQTIRLLNQYKEKCQKITNSLKYDYSYLNEKVKQASYEIERSCSIIKKIKGSAECATNTLRKLLNEKVERIEMYEIYNLTLLNNDWEKMNIKLSEYENKLKECTEKYCNSIKDNISKDVANLVKKIDAELKEIYVILKNKCNYSKEFRANLEEYQSWVRR